MRTFIAIDLTKSIREKIAALQDDLRPRAGGVKWTDPDSIHLTLKFLGDTSEAQTVTIAEQLSQLVAEIAPFEITVKGLGAFGPRGPVRIVWIGVADPTRRLAALRDAVEARIAPLGFPTEDRPFSPHLTIARAARNKRPDPRLRGLIERHPPFHAGSLPVQQIIHYRSTPTPDGSLYEAISTHPLTAADAPGN